ncbi:DUF4118 domain-containing protein [Streptomyces sp. NPDC058155]|uniref:DUF4118 domain-containing protein n=1 Tax=Streptomyces sp. NPDC058155 TaxID=3346359 RepID=UPI0036E24CC4
MRRSLRDVAALAAGFVAPFATALVFMVVVVAVSALGNRLAGAVAALSAAAWFDFLHARPYQSFDIHGRADVETAVLLFAAGVIVTQLAARARILTRVAVTDAPTWIRVRDAPRAPLRLDPDGTVRVAGWIWTWSGRGGPTPRSNCAPASAAGTRAASRSPRHLTPSRHRWR